MLALELVVESSPASSVPYNRQSHTHVAPVSYSWIIYYRHVHTYCSKARKGTVPKITWHRNMWGNIEQTRRSGTPIEVVG